MKITSEVTIPTTELTSQNMSYNQQTNHLDRKSFTSWA